MFTYANTFFFLQISTRRFSQPGYKGLGKCFITVVLKVGAAAPWGGHQGVQGGLSKLEGEDEDEKKKCKQNQIIIFKHYYEYILYNLF